MHRQICSKKCEKFNEIEIEHFKEKRNEKKNVENFIVHQLNLKKSILH